MCSHFTFARIEPDNVYLSYFSATDKKHMDFYQLMSTMVQGVLTFDAIFSEYASLFFLLLFDITYPLKIFITMFITKGILITIGIILGEVRR